MPMANDTMATRITLRLDFPQGGRLGHGKVSLLEAIGRQGSIAAAGREFGMSYRRAWLLVDEVNRMFESPLVAARGGGSGGGGAALTPLGLSVVALYRDAERKASTSAEAELGRIEAALAKP
ncbi:winged helix-turn-helix domain-containing protein [Aureimonas psammosilenae]|uniref:winged helix-turn-helix domain-containing protein n=1 Tax=Aureimonas psammosilenae TaxID=2495496 RepID=UPI001AEF0714|nr:LysR family transcriptional regulator [Aureimonas psammosilenae]